MEAPGAPAADSPEGQAIRRIRDSSAYLGQHMGDVPVQVIACIEVQGEWKAGASQTGLWGSLLPAAWSYMLACRSRELAALRRVAELVAQGTFQLADAVADRLRVYLEPVGDLGRGAPGLQPGPERLGQPFALARGQPFQRPELAPADLLGQRAVGHQPQGEQMRRVHMQDAGGDRHQQGS